MSVNAAAGTSTATVEHQATVDKGLKMKIKRKSVNKANSDGHVKVESNSTNGSAEGGNSQQFELTPEDDSNPANTGSGSSPLERLKQALGEKDKDKVRGGRGANKKERGNNKEQRGGRVNSLSEQVETPSTNLFSSSSNPQANIGALPPSAQTLSNTPHPAGGTPHKGAISSQLSPDPAIGSPAKRSSVSAQPDPYEFNARVEDRISLPMVKKIKTEKMEHQEIQMAAASTCDVGVDTSTIGVATDPDCLGPCEPGTHVVLEGIVWNETQNGILVVNVTWRGKTYVGTLMDATRHDWAPPRFNDESPSSEIEVRTPKGRGKRGRGGAATPVSESCTVGERRLRKTRGRMGSNSTHLAPPPSPAGKRKGRPPEIDLGQDGPRCPKRGRSASRAATPNGNNSDSLIDCPEQDCNKKYKHINGLRYHLTHTHKKNLIVDGDGNMETQLAETTIPPPPSSPKCILRNSQERSGVFADKEVSDAKTKRLDVRRESRQAIRKPSVTLTKIDLQKDLEPSEGGDVFAMPHVPNDGSVDSSHTHPSEQTIKPDPDLLKNPKALKSSRPNSLGRSIMSARTAAVAPTSLASATLYPQVAAMAGAGGMNHDGIDKIKEKKSKKRKKDKEREKSSKESHDEGTKDVKPNLSVIKASTVSIPVAAITPTVASAERKLDSQEPAGLLTVSCATPPQLLCHNALSDLDKQRHSPPRLQKQAGGRVEYGSSHPRPPSQLSLNSPATSQRTDGDDAHSPAYSDISDAADSAPTLENEVHPAKSSGDDSVSTSSDVTCVQPDVKERPPSGGKSPPAVDARRPLAPGFDMYPPSYFGTPPYLSPALTSDVSPRNSSSQLSPANYRNADPNAKRPSLMMHNPSLSPASKTGKDQRHVTGKSADHSRNLATSRNSSAVANGRDNDRKSLSSQSSAASPSSQTVNSKLATTTSTTMAKDYPSTGQRVYSGTNSSYAGYLANRGYGTYGIDPTYHLHLMATNPDYKSQHDKWLKDETRRRQEHIERQKHEGRAPDTSPLPYDGRGRARDASPLPYDGPEQKPVDMSAKSSRVESQVNHAMLPSQRSSISARRDSHSASRYNNDNRSDADKDRFDHATDLSLKEKQIENRQILRENLELKQHMKGCPPNGSAEGSRENSHEARAYYERQQDELQRYYMYQQKCYAEQQRYMYEQGLKSPGANHKHSKSGDSPSPAPMRAPSRDRSSDRPPSSLSAGAPKESNKGRDSQSSFKDSKRSHEGVERHHSREHSQDRASTQRGESTHGPRSGSSSQKAPSRDGLPPCSTPTNMPPNSSYPSHYYPHYPGYEHPSAYSTAMMQYGTSPGPYMHPSQIRYPHTPPSATEGEKDHKSKTPSPSNASKKASTDGRNSEDHNQERNASLYNSPHHKIHELKEAAKSGERRPSSPSRVASATSEKSAMASPPARDEKGRSGSPPPQRHLHTHHHTHVVGAAYPLYPPYPALIASPQGSSVPPIVSQPPFVSK